MSFAIKQQMQETQERLFVFIGKLEDKLNEFMEAAIPELVALNNTDADDNRGYYRMKTAVFGQIDSIRKKANEIKEEKVTYFSYSTDDRETSAAYYTFRSECYKRVRQLEDLCSQYRQKVDESTEEDYETEYQKVLEEHGSIKDKFRCTQCGSAITIDQIYAVTTYLTCPACQTKNTFEPSSKAKNLEGLGRSLAEQRTKHLLAEHHKLHAIDHELFGQVHRLKMDISFSKNKKDAAHLQELEQKNWKLKPGEIPLIKPI